MFEGKTHDFDWAMFNSYVKLSDFCLRPNMWINVLVQINEDGSILLVPQTIRSYYIIWNIWLALNMNPKISNPLLTLNRDSSLSKSLSENHVPLPLKLTTHQARKTFPRKQRHNHSYTNLCDSHNRSAKGDGDARDAHAVGTAGTAMRMWTGQCHGLRNRNLVTWW